MSGRWRKSATTRWLIASVALLIGGAAFSGSAFAQGNCNSNLSIDFPNNDSANRVVGDVVRIRLTLSNGPSTANQTFAPIHYFPSCLNVIGGVCTDDPGETAGAPPPIAFSGNVSAGTCPSVPAVNAMDPTEIVFTFAPALNFADAAGCAFSFDVTVMERGSNGTPASIEQLASVNGICVGGLTSSDTGSASITLTCPPCDDGNACNGLETCDTATAQCQPGMNLNCNDNNACTVDSCIPATGCSNVARPPDFCDDENACTDDTCIPATGCSNVAKPPDFCDDGDECTQDICVPATGCTNPPQPPDFCDDGSTCTDDICVPDEGCTHTPAVPLPVECMGSCRMTGGHNFDIVDAEFNENGKVYTTGGQIGAPNESGCCEFPPKGKCVEGRCTGGLNFGDSCSNHGDCPGDPGRNSSCPWGDWEHNHHSGPDDSNSVKGGSFAFHSGTAAAPNEAFISSVLCADPGWCVQARPAPFKQIFWEGTGVFHNVKGPRGSDVLLPIFEACGENQPVPYNRKNGGTLHYYKAHVGDFGEPAGIHQKDPGNCQYDPTCISPEPNQSVEIGACALGDVCLIDAEADPVKTALHPLCQAQTCSECPDLYEIEIHCTADPGSPIAYRVSHFIREGNFQLHPPVGDTCNPSCGDGVCETGVTGTAETCETCSIDCCSN